MLCGREEEFATLEDLLRKSLVDVSPTPLAIYVNGKPGTGKTFTVRKVIESLQSELAKKSTRGKKKVAKAEFDVIFTTCTSNKVTDLYRAILNQLGKPDEQPRESTVKELLGKNKKRVIILDEIDFLRGSNKKGNTLLYKVFSWPTEFNGNVILIGIANTIDLTERLLPQLKLSNLSLACITFNAYTAEQIKNILISHLHDEDIDPNAIQLCAQKVAKEHGDVRKALDFTRQMMLEEIRQVEEDTAVSLKRVALGEVAPITPKKKRGVREVLAVMNRVSASPIARAQLQFHPRIMLAIILSLCAEKKGAQRVERRIIERVYGRVYTYLQLPEPTVDEVSQALQMLSCQSLIILEPREIVLQVHRETAQEVIANSDNTDIIGSVACAVKEIRL